MAVSDTKAPYEILIRFRSDESGGVIIAAHQQWLRRVEIDGELLKEEVTPPEPLGLDDFPISEVMTAAQANALAQATAYLARCNELQDALTAKEAEFRQELGLAQQAWAAESQKKNVLIAALEARISSMTGEK